MDILTLQHFLIIKTSYFNVKVIVVDWNEKACSLNRENCLLLKKWEGDNADRTLIGLAQLLQGFDFL